MTKNRAALLVVALIATCPVLHRELFAETCYYVGPDGGSWHVPGSWSCGHVPTSSDEARIFDDLGVRITSDIPSDGELDLTVGHFRTGEVSQDGGEARVRNLFLGNGVGTGDDADVGSYTFNAGSLLLGTLNIGTTGGDNVFTHNDGDVHVRFRFWIGAHYDDVSGKYVQQGGAIVSDPSIELAYQGDPSNTGIYELKGGSLTIPRSTPFLFQAGNNIYFDLAGGALYLLDIWDFDRLTSIPKSDFRVFGEAATEETLAFDFVVIENELYTRIEGIPEPSTFTLVIIGWAGLTFCGLRRKRPL